jgi:hypothetical protein
MTKGTEMPEEIKEQMRRTKMDNELKKYDWKFLEPYLNASIDNGKVKRIARFITPLEFKEEALRGKSKTELIKEGVCNGLLTFYTNLAQGKITLTKEKFISLYESGMPLEDIAKNNNITREDITYLRQLFGIKRKGATFQKRKNTELPLTERQKEILYGSLMGDAKKFHPSSAGFGQGTKQRDYLFWKYFEFENISGSQKLIHTPYKGPKGNELHDWRFYTEANTDIETILSMFYRKNTEGKVTKQVTEEILDHLTPLSLAVWYQDDGNTWFYDRFDDTYHPPHCVLCTDSFTLESCEIIRKWFKEKHQYDTILVPRNNGLRIHAAGVRESEHFIEIIKPHVLPMFQYKINYDAYLEWKKTKKDPLIPFKATDIPGMIEEARQEISKWKTM